MASLEGKTLFVTGASRGIGFAIAARAARDGANVTVAAKTDKPHPKLEGTIHSAAEELEKLGGRALAQVVDVRNEASIKKAMQATADTFGGIDILINNASAIYLAGTEKTPMKRFDLMHQVNTRGTFAASQAALPYLKEAANPHVLMISPPLNIEERWFAPHVAYSIAKYGMSLCVLGMAGEFRGRVAFNALWPRTTIATAAVENLLGGREALKHCRKPEIMGDAAHAILTKDAKTCTGNFFIDDDLLAEEGVTDFDCYAVDPDAKLSPDFFV